jgi:hypothetical protein
MKQRAFCLMESIEYIDIFNFMAQTETQVKLA